MLAHKTHIVGAVTEWNLKSRLIFTPTMKRFFSQTNFVWASQPTKTTFRVRTHFKVKAPFHLTRKR
jgi:hypothetical protein